MRDTDLDFTISQLGPGHITSPMSGAQFVDDADRVIVHVNRTEMKGFLDKGLDPPAMEMAGPRRTLFFDPSTIACGIVTCGGLCPGLNDVIRSIVLSLHHHYGVKRIYGFRFGYEGLASRYGHTPIELSPDRVNRIHESGGSFLGSSRGPQAPADMVQTLRNLGVGVLFAIGGDGTLRGAQAIGEEASRQGVKLGVIGIPKTIDNDVSFVQTTFGFETAVTEARRSTQAANAEAEAGRNGIGLVKLMGRDSGFIAAYSVLADSHVNFCLVPEVPFTLERLLDELRRRLERRGHALIVVAEGAGQDLIAQSQERDASGNVRYGDIGVFLRDAITGYFKRIGVEATLKYIDPSYTIRSVRATAHDSAFCLLFGQNAVHAGMSGRTNMVVSFWNHRFTHVPIRLAVSERKKIDPGGQLWSSVLASTGQPRDMR
jgi:6-phosphofructokinase 1